MLLTLPQETLNEVVAHLRGEERALQSLSLVDRRLTGECRRYIFSSVRIDSATKLTRWSDAISPGKDGLSRYVRLFYMEGGSFCATAFLRDHLVTLRSFTQIEHLGIRPLDLGSRFTNKEVVRYFGHFQNTRSVYIQPIGSYHSLLEFLTLFPLLETTVITSPHIWSSSTSLPNVVCRGDLVLRACKITVVPDDILSCFTRSTACYRRLGLEFAMVYNFAPFERFFETCGGSLESVQFINCLFQPLARCPDTLLSTLTNLRDITMTLRFLTDNPNVAAMLSSITSTEINSVALIVWDFCYPEDLDDFCLRWTSIENALCRLSGLKKEAECGGKVVLNVYFNDERFASEVSRFAERGEFLPRFREGGVLKVETRRMDVNHPTLSIVPEEFRC